MTLPFKNQSDPKDKVIAFDWDDTLFIRSLGYNVDAFKAITKLANEGHKICIVTNRGINANDEMSKMEIAMGFMAARIDPIPLEVFAKSDVKTDKFPYQIKLVVDNEDPHDPKSGYLPVGSNPIVIRVGDNFTYTSTDAFLAAVITGLNVQPNDRGGKQPAPSPTAF